jgi:tryptophan halogenase
VIEVGSNRAPRQIKNVVVLGGGTAGFLAALALRKRLPHLKVTVVRSKAMGVIGVGEATIVSVVSFLHRYLGLDPRRFNEQAVPSIKLGIRFLWGKRPFFNYTFTRELSRRNPRLPMLRGFYADDDLSYVDLASALMYHNKACGRRKNGDPHILLQGGFAYHLENKRFVAHLEDLASESGIDKIDDIFDHAEQDEFGIKSLVLKSGRRVEGDLFVDSSGFRSELISGVMKAEYVNFRKSLFCDRAVVGGWERTDAEIYYPFTTAETMNAGWCWRIDHDQLINRGYVFCSGFLSDDEAEREFREKNPKVKETTFIKILAGTFRPTWVKNVVAIGNAAGFVEPLESTSIGMICDSVVHLVLALQSNDGYIEPIHRDLYGNVVFKNWDIIRDFLAIHYKFNQRFDTPFWRHCWHETELGEIQQLIDFYQTVGPDLTLMTQMLKRDPFTAEGYLSLLLGQQVPYKRKVNVPESDRRIWQQYRRKVGAAAENGMDMQECCDFLRTRGFPKPEANPYALPQTAQENVDEMQGGELVWH